MTFAAVLRNLVPEELTEAATSRDLPEFLTLYGDTLFLLVRLGPRDTDLAAGLGATAARAEAGVPVKPVMKSMSFKTHVLSTTLDLGSGEGASQRRGTEPALIEELEKNRHFGVVLRKRASAEAAYPDRISIGRAPNKDIVLRHPSVSKFHGWFEVDDEGRFYIADAGSRNATRINAEVLPAREPTPVDPGDSVRFGSVEALLCSPRMLWTALSGLSKRTG
jgi:FHA domain-containing protein